MTAEHLVAFWRRASLLPCKKRTGRCQPAIPLAAHRVHPWVGWMPTWPFKQMLCQLKDEKNVQILGWRDTIFQPLVSFGRWPLCNGIWCVCVLVGGIGGEMGGGCSTCFNSDSVPCLPSVPCRGYSPSAARSRGLGLRMGDFSYVEARYQTLRGLHIGLPSYISLKGAKVLLD